MNATIFLFVPGENWLMTDTDYVNDSDLRQRAEDFAKKHGNSKWTVMRVYANQKFWSASRGEVVWRD